jgi:CheY-like chemotaxis protein
MIRPGSFRVLLVEDNPHVAELFQYAFQRMVSERFDVGTAIRVEQASDGHAAWQCIEAAANDPFDLVVLDLNLPVLDGKEVLTRIRATPTLAGLPVLVVTAADQEACDEALAKGASALLRKPVQMKDMRAALEQLIG